LPTETLEIVPDPFVVNIACSVVACYDVEIVNISYMRYIQ